MNKIKIGRVFLAGLAAAFTFFFVEIILEGLVFLLSGYNESQMMQEAFGSPLQGTRFQVVNLLVFFSEMIFFMWIFFALRPRFKSHGTAAVATSLVILLFILLIYINFVNLGVFPAKFALISLGFNLIELPVAILVGSNVYKES